MWPRLTYGFGLGILLTIFVGIVLQYAGIVSLHRPTSNIVTRSGVPELEEALSHQQEALKLYIKMGNKLEAAHSFLNISLIYREPGDLQNLQEALNYSHEAAKIYKDIGNKEGEVVALRNLSDIYRDAGNMERASFYQQEAIKLYEEILSDLKAIKP